jgi:hypothetical protein
MHSEWLGVAEQRRACGSQPLIVLHPAPIIRRVDQFQGLFEPRRSVYHRRCTSHKVVGIRTLRGIPWYAPSSALPVAVIGTGAYLETAVASSQCTVINASKYRQVALASYSVLAASCIYTIKGHMMQVQCRRTGLVWRTNPAPTRKVT